MNIIKKLQAKITENFTYAEELDGCNALVDAIQAEYDKLCPKPSEFPKSCNWCAIDPNGKILFSNEFELGRNEWLNLDESHWGDKIKIPFGLDWRLCCWSIEDAKRIHGEDE